MNKHILYRNADIKHKMKAGRSISDVGISWLDQIAKCINTYTLEFIKKITKIQYISNE